MKIQFLVKRRAGEVYQINCNERIYFANTKKQAIRLAKKLVSDRDPFSAKIFPIDRHVAEKMCESNRRATFLYDYE